MEAKVYNAAGEVLREVKLPDAVFGVAINPVAIQRAVTAQQDNARVAIAHTKTRSEVRGGGRKPWRQKGTGRARHGSIRSPIWVGGGITFGPRSDRNFAVRINRKEVRSALRMVLSAKAQDARVVLVDALASETAKTKPFAQMLAKLPSARSKNLLIVQEKPDRKTVIAARNLPQCSTILANSLNIRDVLKAQYLIMPEAALKVVAATFGKKYSHGTP